MQILILSFFAVSIAMAYDTNSIFVCNPYYQKSFFILRMFRIIKQNSVFVIKHGFCFFKRDAMFTLVNFVFIFIPFKSYHIHNYIIIII